MNGPISRRTWLAGATACALAPIAAASAAQPADQRAPFRRGVSIHNLMNWAAVEPSDKTRYAWPPFATMHHQIQPQIYDNIVSAGFDFVRLTIDAGIFLQTTGERRAELDTLLTANIRKLQGMGLGVVVDFHSNSQVAAYDPVRITETLGSALFNDYGAMLERTARLLGGFKGTRIALELMNEPQYGWDGGSAARWQTMQEQWHARVRAVAPDLTLILTGARGGNADGLKLINATPFKGSDVLWSFHYYEPYELTHQGVKFDSPKSRSWRYFTDLPYPAAPEHFEYIWRIVQANLAADKTLSTSERATYSSEAKAALTKYLDARPGRATVARDFASVEDWAKRHDIAPHRIFLGEFGITRTYGQYHASPPQTLGHWLSDVRSEAEARGFGWALWALSGYGGMALVETDESVRFDTPTIAALGLKP